MNFNPCPFLADGLIGYLTLTCDQISWLHLFGVYLKAPSVEEPNKSPPPETSQTATAYQ